MTKFTLGEKNAKQNDAQQHKITSNDNESVLVVLP